MKFECVEAVVALGADVHARSNTGATAFHLRARTGDTEGELVRYLLAKGLDINQRDTSGKTPLAYAKYDAVGAVLRKHGAI